MLSIKPLTGTGSEIFGYLSESDSLTYYEESAKVVGEWFGKGAASLGLSGAIKGEDFDQVKECNDPRTGQFLRQRVSENKMYDLTFSAPKSVSMMARPGGDRRLDGAHKRAVTEALIEAEKNVCCEVQKDGNRFDRKTNSLIVARFMHDTSRDLDPQLHEHCAVSNMTFDEKENRWKAVHASAIFERKAYLQEVYRNALAREVMKLGYQIENRTAGRNGDKSFEIVGLDKSLLEKFSKMSERIAEGVEEFKKETGSIPSDRQVGQIAHTVRPEKLKLSSEEVAARQEAQLEPEEKEQMAAVLAAARANDGFEPEVWSSEDSVRHEMSHVFERRSVERDFEIARRALIHGRGHLTPEGIEACFKDLKKQGVILRHGKEIATHETLSREKAMIWLVDQGLGQYGRLDNGKEFVHAQNADGSEKLNESQKAAVDFLFASRDFAVNLKGAAGVGKTHTLGELYRGLKESGWGVVAVAPTGSAKHELQKIDPNLNPMTVEKLIGNKLAVDQIRNKVVILDEAGMVSNRGMFELLRIGREANARFVFSGDTHQTRSVEAGDALLSLEKESKLRSHELTDVIRQTDKVYNYAVRLMRQDPQQGFDLLCAMGAVKEVPFLDRADAIAAELEKKPGAIIVGSTHAENDRINKAVAAPGEKRKFERLHPLQLSKAEKRDLRNYEPGQYLLFHRATDGGKVDNAYRVIKTDQRFIRTVDLKGKEVSFSKKQSESFGVFEKKEVEVGVGDKLIFNANAKQKRFECVNGHFDKVAAFDKKGRAVLESGQTLPENFFQWNLGSAITTPKSQGKTGGDSILATDRMCTEDFYVAATRGQKSVMIFTTDIAALRESVGISGARSTALELERQCAAAIGGSNVSAGPPPNVLAAIEDERRRQKVRHYAAESYRDCYMNSGTQLGNESGSLRDYCYTFTQVHQDRGGRSHEIGSR